MTSTFSKYGANPFSPESVAKAQLIEELMALYGRGTDDPVATRRMLEGKSVWALANSRDALLAGRDRLTQMDL